MAVTKAHYRNSVVQPESQVWGSRSNYLFLQYAQSADATPPWGTAQRDIWLRSFWKTEDMLASGVYTMTSKYASYDWTLEGLPKTCAHVRGVLNASEHGLGWSKLMLPTVQDLLTQDNGGHIEIVREEDRPDSPCIQLNHLDSLRCTRTGNWETPIIYRDIKGGEHELKWYQVISLAEFPSPEETARGMQLCAVSRMLRAAQIMRDIAIYNQEKVAGQFNRQLNIVSGVSKNAINDALQQQRTEASQQGFQRFILPVILTALDPRANLTKTTIDLASLPDGFDPEVAMRLYVIQMALAFGTDPQDFAPLPGQNIGSSQQSQTLHEKGRGKGPALFMAMIEQELNYQGIMPRSVTFKYGTQDSGLAEQREKIQLLRAQKLSILVKSGVYTPEVAARLLVDTGDIPAKFLPLLGYEIDDQDEIILPRIGEVPDYSKLPPVKPRPLLELPKAIPELVGSGGGGPRPSNNGVH